MVLHVTLNFVFIKRRIYHSILGSVCPLSTKGVLYASVSCKFTENSLSTDACERTFCAIKHHMYMPSLFTCYQQKFRNQRGQTGEMGHALSPVVQDQ